MIRGIMFLSCSFVCLSFCLSVCPFVCLLSTLSLAITFEPQEIERLHIWHAYWTNDALSKDTKVNDLLTLTLTFVLKIAFSEIFADGAIVFHEHMYFCCYSWHIVKAVSNFILLHGFRKTIFRDHFCLLVSICLVVTFYFRQLALQILGTLWCHK